MTDTQYCSKAKAQLQWAPRWRIEKALLKTVEWYQACQRREHMQDFTVAQIEDF
jgi:CDP-glucose 4,6-dehydratase